MATAQDEQADQRRSLWVRGIIMVFLLIALSIAHSAIGLIALVQFLWLLFSGEPNQFLARFGTSLANWVGEVVRYLCCTGDDKPFPWREWPT